MADRTRENARILGSGKSPKGGNSAETHLPQCHSAQSASAQSSTVQPSSVQPSSAQPSSAQPQTLQSLAGQLRSVPSTSAHPVSRRSLIGGGLSLSAAAAVTSALPLGNFASAHGLAHGLAHPGGQGGGHAGAPTPVTRWTRVQEMIDVMVGNGKLANMVASLGWGEGEAEALKRGNLGFASEEAAGMDSLYRIYSMTKPITGMAVMMLIEDGALTLDQPLAEILPKFAQMKVQKTYDGGIGEADLEPSERPITIRHLLTHTAGLGYSIIQKGPIKRAYEEAGVVPGQVGKTPLAIKFSRGKAASSLREFADNLAELPLVHQPGSAWSYSVSLDLLGRVIEVVSGQDFAAFLQARIFGPCGMNSTWFRVPQSELHRMTSNYGILPESIQPLDPGSTSIFADEPPFAMGGAGLVSSPRDYDRFLKMLAGFGIIDGKQVMAKQTVQIATSNLLPAAVNTDGTMVDGSDFGAGGRVGRGPLAGTYGWGGAAGTVGFVSLNAGLRAGMFTQYMPSEAYLIHVHFPAAVRKDLMAMQSAAAHVIMPELSAV